MGKNTGKSQGILSVWKSGNHAKVQCTFRGNVKNLCNTVFVYFCNNFFQNPAIFWGRPETDSPQFVGINFDCERQ